jgi:DNA-binding transcriptional LysR family regulator
MKGFARRKGGITLLPKMAIDREVATGVLVGVPIRNKTFNRTTIEVCVLARRRLPLAVSKFLRELKEHRQPLD